MDELESTLRIRVDRTELDEALRMIREDLERSVTVSFTKALREARAAVGGAAGTGSGGPGAGPAPASSANPSERRSRRRGGGAGDGGGGEDAPPEPTSSAAPSARGRDARGRFTSGQTAGEQLASASAAVSSASPSVQERDVRGRFAPPRATSSRDVADASAEDAEDDRGAPGGRPRRYRPFRRGWQDEHLASGGLDLSALVAGNPIGAAVRTGSSALRGAALARAREIEEAREAGLTGPAMGLLRYATPVTIAAAIATAGVGKALGESAGAGDRFASMSQDMAFGAAAGAFSSFHKNGRLNAQRAFAVGADPRFGAMSPEEVAAYGRSFGQIGFNRVSDAARDGMWQARNTGTSDGAINALVANERLGVSGIDPRHAIVLAQRQGLFGSAVDQYLSTIAQHTQTMAMRGVRVDQQEMLGILRAASFTPGLMDLGERGPAALASLGGHASSVRDEFLAPFQKMGRARLWQAALRGSNGTLDGLEESFDRLVSSSGDQLAAVHTGPASGLVARAMMPQLTSKEARELTPENLEMGQRLGKAFDPLLGLITLDQIKDRDGKSLLSWKGVNSSIGASQMEGAGTQESYEWQKWTTENRDKMWRDLGGWIAGVGRDITEGLRLNSDAIVRAIREEK